MTGAITVKDVTVNEDGSATYTFDLDDAAEALVMEEGLKFVLYCGLTKLDIQDVYDWMLKQSETIRPMTTTERNRAAEREEKNKAEG